MSRKNKKVIRQQVADTEARIEDLFGIEDDTDFLFSLSEFVSCQGMADYAGLPRLGKLVAASYAFDLETDNSGFHAFLEGEAGGMADDMIGFLRELGSTEILPLMDSIASRFPSGKIPFDRAERMDVLEKLERGGSADPFQKESGLYGGRKEKVVPLLRSYLSTRKEELIDFIKAREASSADRLNARMAEMDREMADNLAFLNGLSDQPPAAPEGPAKPGLST